MDESSSVLLLRTSSIRHERVPVILLDRSAGSKRLLNGIIGVDQALSRCSYDGPGRLCRPGAMIGCPRHGCMFHSPPLIGAVLPAAVAVLACTPVARRVEGVGALSC